MVMTTTKKVALPVVAREVPPRYRHWVDKAERRSYKAAVALKCLSCCNWDSKEVRDCHLEGCSLHHIRPYKHGPKPAAE